MLRLLGPKTLLCKVSWAILRLRVSLSLSPSLSLAVGEARGRVCHLRLATGATPEIFHLLGGSWVAISGVLSNVTIVITHIRALITPLITTHAPPSRG